MQQERPKERGIEEQQCLGRFKAARAVFERGALLATLSDNRELIQWFAMSGMKEMLPERRGQYDPEITQVIEKAFGEAEKGSLSQGLNILETAVAMGAYTTMVRLRYRRQGAEGQMGTFIDMGMLAISESIQEEEKGKPELQIKDEISDARQEMEKAALEARSKGWNFLEETSAIGVYIPKDAREVYSRNRTMWRCFEGILRGRDKGTYCQEILKKCQENRPYSYQLALEYYGNLGRMGIDKDLLRRMVSRIPGIRDIKRSEADGEILEVTKKYEGARKKLELGLLLADYEESISGKKILGGN